MYKQLKKELSQEWNKPKKENIKNEHDKREPRSYKKIRVLQERIRNYKNSVTK